MQKTTPRASIALHSTVREDGRPSISAVASTIAVGSGNSASTASASQPESCCHHVGAIDASSSAELK